MFEGVLKIVVVDDSALYRQMLLTVLGRIAGVEVVGTAADGDAAVELIARARPDVVTLDVQMPGRDGIEVLRAFKQRGLSPRSIMVSSLTAQGAPTTVAALMEGAFDFILKPAGVDLNVSRDLIQRELAEKLVAVRESMGGPAVAAATPSPERPPERPSGRPPRPSAAARFDAIVIGTSTGGPQALRAVIPLLPADLPVPVFVVQHIPSQFTASLAERLDGMSPLRVVEATDGMLVAPGMVLVAPGAGTSACHIAASRSCARSTMVRGVVDVGRRSTIFWSRRRGSMTVGCWRRCSPGWGATGSMGAVNSSGEGAPCSRSPPRAASCMECQRPSAKPAWPTRSCHWARWRCGSPHGCGALLQARRAGRGGVCVTCPP